MNVKKKEKLLQLRKRLAGAGLYEVPAERFEELAEIAADAYSDYPLHVWFGKGRYDATASDLIMKITLKSMKKEAVIYADSAEMKGFAVVLPPGFTGSKVFPFLVYGGLRLIIHAGPGIIGRLLTYENFAMSLKKQITGNEDWYIYNLSVKTKFQGQGIAKKLLNPVLDFFREEKETVYLETNKESNVGLYRRFGFSLARQEKIPGSTVEHYAMVKK